MGSDFKYILEMWRDGGFALLASTNHKWSQMDEVLNHIEERFKLGDEGQRMLRATLESFDERFKMVVENGPGGGWARLCGKRTGQRG